MKDGPQPVTRRYGSIKATFWKIIDVGIEVEEQRPGDEPPPPPNFLFILALALVVVVTGGGTVTVGAYILLHLFG